MGAGRAGHHAHGRFNGVKTVRSGILISSDLCGPVPKADGTDFGTGSVLWNRL